jgi:integrase
MRTARGTETKGTALTSVEVKSFLDSAQVICPDYFPLFLVAVRAGLRRGELVSLQWGDLQFGKDEYDTNRFFLVQHNYVRREHTNTKSKKARRVDMSREVRKTLIELRDQRLLDAFSRERQIFPRIWCFHRRMEAFLIPTTCIIGISYPY